ncbi:RNA polymerase sigma factor SigY [Brevibacillus sp. NRS-1366]|uniref:RNA polymerase sigma factor SigY n=1 Tax=Brevibacillus sp. NRS-1366 TaxID=3233899 RepID=UPI003D1B6EB7
MDERDLIKQAQQGNHQALSDILQKHYVFLKSYLLKITVNPYIAEDLTQETLIKAIEKITLYDGRSSFSSWLITIGSRLYIDSLRKQNTEKRWTERQKAISKMKWAADHQNRDWPEFLEILLTLTEEYRIPLILKHYYGYTYREIADILHVREGTVKSRVHHASQQLRKEWLDDEKPSS